MASWTVKTQAEVGRFFSVSRRTVGDWTRQGMPGRSGRYSLPRIVRWRVDRVAELAKSKGDDPVASAMADYRVEKANLARLDRLERQGELMSRERIRSGLGRIAAIIRITGDALQRQYGVGAADLLYEALDDCEKDIDQFFGPCTAGDAGAKPV